MKESKPRNLIILGNGFNLAQELTKDPYNFAFTGLMHRYSGENVYLRTKLAGEM